jgi:hypothetical protein
MDGRRQRKIQELINRMWRETMGLLSSRKLAALEGHTTLRHLAQLKRVK